MTTIAEIILMDKFKNDPRREVFTKWCDMMPKEDEDKVIEFLSDVFIELLKLKLDEFGIK